MNLTEYLQSFMYDPTYMYSVTGPSAGITVQTLESGAWYSVLSELRMGNTAMASVANRDAAVKLYN